MCGLAGVLGCGEAVSAAIGAMGEALRHRGPDDEGHLAEGPVALAHRRLAIVDLSQAGHQPIEDATGRFAMVYNGEIYNHRALREQHLRGCSFRGTSDSETLLELFARKRADAFGLLNGIFAAAIWDRRERTLTLVRDGAGIKPLYLWRRPAGGIAFASELKALIELPGFDSPLDRTAAAAYVSYLWSPGERTMFSEVRKFPAGEWAAFSEDGREAATGRFYSLPDYRPVERSDEDAISGVHDTLSAAVERQMLADVEVGAFLSGGLDSTAIVHFARGHQPGRRMRCFTLAYAGDEGEEMAADLPYARRAAEHLGVDLHEVAIDPASLRDLPELVDILDEPQADPAAMANLIISRAAREQGIKVLLGGAGGDDVFSGYRRHLQFAHDRLVGLVPGAVRAGALRALRASGLSGRARRVDRLLAGMQGTESQRLRRAFEWLELDRACALIEGPPSPHDVAQPMTAALSLTEGQPALERLLRLDQAFFLRDHNLNYTDKTGMAAGVEIRVPFLDPELMQFAATLPVAQKLRGKSTKWALRKAMEPHLPHEVIYRPKTGFGVPLRAWMGGPLREMVFDLTSGQAIRGRGLFDPSAVAQLRDDHYAGRIDGAYPLLAVMMIELWCRRFT